MQRTQIIAVALAAWAAFLGGGGAWAGEEAKFRYHYVSLDAAVAPGHFFFDPAVVTDDGRVYGNVYDCGDVFCFPSVTVYRNGSARVLQAGYAITANARGTIGGSVQEQLDPETVVDQAALFNGGEVKILPRLPGEYTSTVIRLTDSGLALVVSYDQDSSPTYYLYRDGRATPLDLSPSVFRLDMNNQGLISGSISLPPAIRAFRFYPPGGLQVLEPVASDPYTYGEGINNSGLVLGYSFTGYPLERVGVWKGTVFQTYVVQGTSTPVGQASDRLRWNDSGLIVITQSFGSNSSFLVPKPGVRLDLKELTDQTPVPLRRIHDLNQRGDMIGSGYTDDFTLFDDFLLERVAAAPGVEAGPAVAKRAAPEASARRSEVRRRVERQKAKLAERFPALTDELDHRGATGRPAKSAPAEP